MRVLALSSRTSPALAIFRRFALAVMVGVAAVAVTRAQTAPPSPALILAPTSGTGTGTWTFIGISAPGSSVRVSLVSGPAGTTTPAGPLSGAPAVADGAAVWSYSATLAGPAGTYTFNASNSLTSGNFSVPAPRAANGAPALYSIYNGNVESAAPNEYTVTFIFTEPVSGVDAGDFSFVTSGDAQASVKTITPDPSGTAYAVRVLFGGTTGTIAVRLASGTGTAIRDSDGNAFTAGATSAAFTLPRRADGNGTAPQVTSVSSPATGGYSNGAFDMIVRFSATVTVTGTPRIPVTIGGQGGRFARYLAGTASTDLVFRYDVTASDSGPVAIGGAIDLNGGAIRDAAGRDASLTFAPPDLSRIVADGVPPATPVVSSATASSTPTIRGTAEPNSSVFLSIVRSGGSSAAIGTASTGPDGNWQYDWFQTPLSGGTYAVTATARDAAGNLSPNSSAFSFTVPATPEPGGRDITPPTSAGWRPGVVDPATPNVVTFWHGFSEPVTGFDASDVLVDATGDARAVVGTPQPADSTGAAYLIPVTFSGTSGTLKVSVPGGAAANIRDLAGNLYGNGGDSYVMFTLPTPNAPLFSGQLAVNATVGTPFTYQVTASGSPTSYAVVGTLPAWLQFDAATHTLSGTPTVSDVYRIGLTATNAAGTGSGVLSIDVYTANGVSGSARNAPPTLSDTTVNGQVGTPIAPVQLSFTGSPTAFNAPDLASYGLMISHTGLITGTPTDVAVAVRIGITASAPNGTSAPAAITLNLRPAPAGSTPTGGTPASGAPVVADAAVTGQVGLTIRPVQVQATGSPTIFNAPGLSSYGLAIDRSGVISGTATAAADNVVVRVTAANPNGTSAPAEIRLNIAPGQQSIAVATPSAKVTSDQPITLAATASSGLPVTYTVVSGPATVVDNTVVFTGSGTVVVKAVQPGNGSYTAADSTITLSAVPIDRLVNVSSRMHVAGGAAGQPAIVGFVVTGTAPKQVLIRAVGPSLGSFGVADALADPRLQVFDATGKVVAANAGWGGDAALAAAASGVGAFALPSTSKDAAVLTSLPPGAYTTQVSSSSSGTVLIEVYDTGAVAAVPTKQLVNISARGTVDGDTHPLVSGFVVAGTEPKRVLVRAIGPALAAFGVEGALVDPVLKVYDGTGKLLAQNDNWSSAGAAEIAAANSAVGAFALQAGSADAALILSLDPGQYSAVVTGAANASGTALVEVYDLP